MLRDITVGQFFPGNSLLHRLDPRIKLTLTFLYIVCLFLVKNFFGLGMMLLFAVGAALASRISPKLLWRSLKALIFIILFTSALQIFYNKDGNILWKPFPNHDFAITDSGVFTALFISARMVALIVISALLTYTTSPTMLTDAIERLLSPLSHFHIKVHALAMMMTIALRFIPTLIEELDIIMNAQKARGAKFDSGSIADRLKALSAVFIPLFVSAFRRASELAVAMESRCYTDAPGRTRLKQMRLKPADYLCFSASVLFCAGLIVTTFYPVSSLWLFEPVI